MEKQKDIYYVVEENTLVYTTGRPDNQFGVECGVLVASNIKALLHGRAKKSSRFRSGDNIRVSLSAEYRVATKEDFNVFGVQYPSNA